MKSSSLSLCALCVATVSLASCRPSSITMPQVSPSTSSARVGQPTFNASPCATSSCIYVTSAGIAFGAITNVTVYRATAGRKAAPVQTISGNATGLKSPFGIAVNSDREIFVANSCFFSCGGSITVYATGANGNVAPIRTIEGSSTGLSNPGGIALDGRLIYVTNITGNSVTVYPAGAHGNMAPVRTLIGLNTGIHSPTGIALDTAGKMYVVNSACPGSFNGNITVYAARANGDAKPLRTLQGSKTKLACPSGIALANDRMYVVNTGNGAQPRVTVYAAGAHRNAAPIQTIIGPKTELHIPLGIAVGDDHLYVANQDPLSYSGPWLLTVYPKNAKGDVSPIRILKNQWLVGMQGVAFH